MIRGYTLLKLQSIYNNKTVLNEYTDTRLNSLIQHNIGIEFSDDNYQKTHKGFTNEQAHLSTLISKYNKKEGCLKIKIKTPDHGWGRIQPEDHASLSVLHRPTRHSLCDKTYIDIDIYSCCQSVFKNIAELNGHSYPYLNEYLENRDLVFDTLMTKYKVNKNKIKNLFTSLSFGGHYNTWFETNKINNDNEPFIINLHREYQELMEIIYDANPQICVDILKSNPNKFIKYTEPKDLLNKKKRTTMACFYQTAERYLQESMIDYLVKTKDFKLKDIVPCQDGFMILSNLNYPGLVDECVLVVNNKFNFNLKLKIKEFDEKFEVPPYVSDKELKEQLRLKKEEEKLKIKIRKEEVRILKEQTKLILEENKRLEEEELQKSYLKEKELLETSPNFEICKDDNSAAIVLLSRLNSKIFYYEGKFFLKLKNIWSCDKDYIDKYLFNYILVSNIHKEIKDFAIPYAQNKISAMSILTCLLAKIVIEKASENLYHKFHTTTKNRICFLDGVLDFNAKRFYLWEEIDFEYYTTVQIDREYSNYFNNPVKKDIDDVKEKIFENMYADNTTLALQFLSRAITGNFQDKNALTYIGNRDCGKGCQYDLLETAFCNYVKTFEIGNMLFSRKSAGSENVDCSKKLYWLMDLEFVRLAISQEVPDSTSNLQVNSKIWKKACGGGDTIVARRNFDRVDTHFKIDATFVVYGNNALEFDNEDCWSHILSLNSVNRFISQEEIDQLKTEEIDELEMKRYKLSSPTIKDDCKTIAWGNAAIYLLFQNYTTSPIKIHNHTDTDIVRLITQIKQKFILTNNPDDKIKCAEVYASLPLICKKKLIIELASFNIFKKRSKELGPLRDKECFYGIKIITEEEKPSISI
jgi:hypothetical protein